MEEIHELHGLYPSPALQSNRSPASPEPIPYIFSITFVTSSICHSSLATDHQFSIRNIEISFKIFAREVKYFSKVPRTQININYTNFNLK